jgi:hypothetical protein
MVGIPTKKSKGAVVASGSPPCSLAACELYRYVGACRMCRPTNPGVRTYRLGRPDHREVQVWRLCLRCGRANPRGERPTTEIAWRSLWLKDIASATGSCTTLFSTAQTSSRPSSTLTVHVGVGHVGAGHITSRDWPRRRMRSACRGDGRSTRGAERVIVRTRELLGDVGWIVTLVLLLPVALPIGALAFLFLLGQRFHAWTRSRMQAGFVG